MKKIALLLLVGVVAVSPAAAATKKKGKIITASAEQKHDPNEAAGRLILEGFPLILPTWALPFYFSTHPEQKKKTKKM